MKNNFKLFVILLCISGIVVAVPTSPSVAPNVEATSIAAATEVPTTTTCPLTTTATVTKKTTKTEVSTTIETSAPTTTTEFTSTSGALTIAATSETNVDAVVEEIRVCSCDEVKECNEKSYKKVNQCKESCKSNLEYFGTSIDKYLTCFNDAVEETKKITKCLQSNVNNFCVENPKESAFIPKPNYSVYFESYGVNEDTLEKTPQLQKKAREVFIQQRKFQTCVIECFKKESVKCYENLGCAIGFPGKDDTAAILESCPLFKSELHMNAMKQCQCLAFKQDVKKLVGKCAYVVSPYLMRKL